VAFITPKGMRTFQVDRKIANPPAEFIAKRIRVKGKIKLHNDKPEIAANHPDQIELVKEQK
jgi:hypothetical protein